LRKIFKILLLINLVKKQIYLETDLQLWT